MMTPGKPPASADPDMEILFRRVAGQPRPADIDTIARPSPPARASHIRLSPRRRRLDRERIAALAVLVLALVGFLVGALTSAERSATPAPRVATEPGRAVAMSSRSSTAAPAPAPVPAPVPAGAREEMVRAFYDALGKGDGETASALVVAEKRSTEAFSAQAISRFYGGLREPLQLTTVTPLEGGAFRVNYGYSAGRSRCDGAAEVSLSTRDGREFIRSIRALNGC